MFDLCCCVCRSSGASLGWLQRGGDHPAADPGSVCRELHSNTSGDLPVCVDAESCAVIAGQEELPARPSGRSSVPLRHGADVPAGGGHAGGGRAPQSHALRPCPQTVSSVAPFRTGTRERIRLTCVDVFDSVKEEMFWRNYFYRVSLIKQSAQLTALAAQQQKDDGESNSAVSPENVVLTG